MTQINFPRDRLPKLIAEIEAVLADLDAHGAQMACAHLAHALDVLRAQLKAESELPGWSSRP
jgi:hypothetical protein